MLKRLALLLAVLIIVACGGGGGGGISGGGGGGNNGVVLNINNANLSFGQTLNLTATVPGVASQVVTWTTTGGSITPTGASSATYTAPSTAGTFTITARSSADATKTGTCAVTVSSIGITIDPLSTTLGPGKSTTFTATVTGATNLTANLTANGGTIVRINSSQFTYTAPSATGTYTVTASAVADPSKKATATVTVANLGGSATVNGFVRLDGSVTGVGGIVVAFYNSSGAELGRVTTAADGHFSATIPATAKTFQLVASSLQPNYYAQYTYGIFRYTALVTTCRTNLPTLTAGNSTTLGSSIYINSSTEPPPPPPNGCTP
jgi:hypothetical protein